MENTFITFIVPAYNAEKTISRTLDSILYQTNRHFHIIVVNDGSIDGTSIICEKYARAYSDKITYVYQENRGLGGARNHGMKLAKTTYVSFLDSDDWLMSDYVENIEKEVIAYNLKHPDKQVEMIMTLPRIYNEKSKSVRDWYDKQLFDEIFPSDGIVVNPKNKLEIYRFEVNQCRKVLNIDFARNINFSFKEKTKWEDVFPHFYLLSKCTVCMGIGSVGFYYRIAGEGQITASRGKDRLDFLNVLTDLVSYIKSEEIDELRFPAMRVIVRFSIWCIRMSDDETRRYLVSELHKKFRQIPNSFFKDFKVAARHEFSKKDLIQYRLFLIAIRYRFLNFVFYDYLYQDVGEKIIKKILKAGPKVA